MRGYRCALCLSLDMNAQRCRKISASVSRLGPAGAPMPAVWVLWRPRNTSRGLHGFYDSNKVLGLDSNFLNFPNLSVQIIFRMAETASSEKYQKDWDKLGVLQVFLQLVATERQQVNKYT